MNDNPDSNAAVNGPQHAPLLFSPFDINGKVTAKNRFFKSAMSEVLAGIGKDLPTEQHLKVYRRWAEGGTGILVTGNVMIDPTALGEPGNVVLEDDRHLDLFAEWASVVHTASPGTQFWMQINHPGKQSPKFLSSNPVAPSAIPLGKGLEAAFTKPRALVPDAISALIKRYATTARLAKQAGFDGVQIHGAHGYLVSQFLSPHHNQRDDDWGGTPEKRRRFVVEVYRAMRAETGADYPVAIKMNSADFQRGGFEGEEALDAVEALSAEGIDLIEISGGNYESPAMTGARQSTSEREAYFLDFAAQARARVRTPIAVTGGFRSVAAMEAALATGATDFVGLARPLTLDPDLPNNAARDPGYVMNVGRPSTGIRSLDRTFMIPITYYESQIRRMGNGKHPDPNMSAWRTVMENGLGSGVAAFKKRRA